MNIRKFSKKKAISPILATVILIAITLIAAVAIAGFVFGLFSSFTSSANVTASGTQCSITAGTCLVTLTNTGTASASVQGCSIQNAGSAEGGIPTGTLAITGGAAGVTVTCTITGVVSVPGSQAGGSFTMSNGAIVPFSGVWNL